MTQDAKQVGLVVLAWIARLLAAGGGGALVAYGIFRWLGKSWLDQHFSKQLEQFKHDRQTELEQFRHQINALFSRISKIHEKEFEVLPKAWELLHRANGATFDVVKALKEYPDFTQMPPPVFEEFVKGCRLSESQKNELRTVTDKQKYYRETIYWRDWGDANNARIELGNYLILNSIFMTENLRQKFREINDALARVLLNEKYQHDAAFNIELHKSTSESMDKISKMFSQIELAVQTRLRYEEA